MNDIPQHPSPSGASVRFLTGPLAGSVFPLVKLIVTIGRAADNDIIIVNDPSLASHHARLL